MTDRVYAETATVTEVVERKRATVGHGIRELISLPTGNRVGSNNESVRMVFGAEAIYIEPVVDYKAYGLSEQYESGVGAQPPEIARFEK